MRTPTLKYRSASFDGFAPEDNRKVPLTHLRLTRGCRFCLRRGQGALVPCSIEGRLYLIIHTATRHLPMQDTL